MQPAAAPGQPDPNAVNNDVNAMVSGMNNAQTNQPNAPQTAGLLPQSVQDYLNQPHWWNDIDPNGTHEESQPLIEGQPNSAVPVQVPNTPPPPPPCGETTFCPGS